EAQLGEWRADIALCRSAPAGAPVGEVVGDGAVDDHVAALSRRDERQLRKELALAVVAAILRIAGEPGVGQLARCDGLDARANARRLRQRELQLARSIAVGH